jgi:hypothetical protein
VSSGYDAASGAFNSIAWSATWSPMTSTTAMIVLTKQLDAQGDTTGARWIRYAGQPRRGHRSLPMAPNPRRVDHEDADAVERARRLGLPKQPYVSPDLSVPAGCSFRRRPPTGMHKTQLDRTTPLTPLAFSPSNPVRRALAH